MRIIVTVIVLMGSIGTIPAAPRETPVPAATLLGKPTIEPNRSSSLYVWIEVDSVHVRWTTAGKPVLFSGSLSFDRPIRNLTRVLEIGSGWVIQHGDRTVMFSTTSRNGLDGFDVSVPNGRRANLDLRIDGNTPSLDQVLFGVAKTPSMEIPTLLLLR